MCDIDNPCENDQICDLNVRGGKCRSPQDVSNLLKVSIQGQIYAGSENAIVLAIEEKYRALYDPECQSGLSLSIVEETEGQVIVNFMDLDTEESLCETKQDLLDYWYETTFKGYYLSEDEKASENEPIISFKNLPMWPNKYITEYQADEIQNSQHYIFAIAPTQYMYIGEESEGQVYYVVPVGYQKEGGRMVRPRQIPLIPPLWETVQQFRGIEGRRMVRPEPRIPLIPPLWDVVQEFKGIEEATIPTPDLFNEVNASLSFNNIGTMIASGDVKGFKVWDTSNYRRIFSEPLTMPTRGSVRNQVRFHPDIPELLFSGLNGVYLYDVEGRALIDTIPTGDIRRLIVGAEKIYTREHVPTSHTDQDVVIRDIETKAELNRFPNVGVGYISVNSTETLFAYNIQTFQPPHISVVMYDLRSEQLVNEREFTTGISNLSFSHSEDILVVYPNQNIHIMNPRLETLNEIQYRRYLGDLSFNPTGELLVGNGFSMGDNPIPIWSTRNWELITTERVRGRSSVYTLTFDPSRRAHLALGTIRNILFWDLSSLIR